MNKTISIIQPWATLVALNEKRIETRSWATKYRGELYIHASKKIDIPVCRAIPFLKVLMKYEIAITNDLPTGAIIAKCNLVDCVKIIGNIENSIKLIQADLENGKKVEGNELAFGDYTIGRYVWMLENIQMLDKPIPAKGKLGLWDCSNYFQEGI